MEKLKFTLFSITTLALLGLVGYWAVVTLQSGPEHMASQKIKQLEKENGDLQAQVEKDREALSFLQAQAEASMPVEKADVAPVSYKNQDLINELQRLVENNVVLKQKSSGTPVGTVQKFLNIYNNTNSRVDNDYGINTGKLVSAFEKDSGLKANSEADSATFSKMIDWLKRQS